jgi:ABC-2 type transport system ATP-binding protein
VAAVISAQGLVKAFGSTMALDGVDLEVAQCTVLGLLGPNGAGKTTAVRVLTTLLRPDAGRAFVAGVDVLKHPATVRGLIGVSGQYAAVDEYLSGRENLQMVGELYQMRPKDAKYRARELLEWFELSEVADRPAKTYSGGMRRRLDLAAALVVRPPVIFLDEPTTGLDPHSRLMLWKAIATLAEEGTTILLTTQYLEEADRLAHNIVVVDHGRVIASGAADDLKARLGGQRVEVIVHDRASIAAAAGILTAFTGSDAAVEQHTRKITVAAADGVQALADLALELADRRIQVDDMSLRRPTLDDVFLRLTGHAPEATAVPAAMAGAHVPGAGATADDGAAPETGRAC